MRGKGYSLLLGKFLSNTIGKFFTMRTNGYWNYLPRDVVDFLVLDTEDLAEQGAGPSSLDWDFAKKG